MMLSRSFISPIKISKSIIPAASTSVAWFSAESSSKYPRWLQEIFLDKKIYFNSVEEIEKDFLTSVKAEDEKFLFTFDNSPNKKFKTLQVSFAALRESCRCPECFFPSSQQRLHLLYTANLDNKPETCHFDKETQLLKIKWSHDGHESVFSGPCIFANFSAHPLYEYQSKRLWNAKQYMEEFQAFDFEHVYSTDSGLLEFLESLEKYGLVKLTNAPKKTGALAQLAKKINYIRTTHYGGAFQVENKPNASNLAYSAGKLLQHIDLLYYDHMPGTQFLHCVRSSAKGGESTFSDSFAVAEWLRSNKTDVFKALTKPYLRTLDCTADAHEGYLMQNRPPIILKNDGSIDFVAYNNATYDTIREVPPDDQIIFLKALQTFIAMNESEEFNIEFKLKEGEIVAFDNCRVTHGRKAFDPSHPRLLEGCYFDWDQLHSRMRLVRAKQFRQQLEDFYSKKF